MIAAWMTYTVLTTLLLAVAARAGERIARAVRAPTRMVWAAAVMTATTLAVLSLLGHRAVVVSAAARQTPHEAPQRVQRPATQVGTTEPVENLTHGDANVASTTSRATVMRPRLGRAVIRLDPARWQPRDPVLAAIVEALAIAGSLIVMISIAHLYRLSRALTPSQLEDTPVLLSHDVGPAVVGFLRPRIVIPQWVVALPRDERHVILLHEMEHAATRDPMLALLGVLALALMPWNLPLWMIVVRLRFALEADCDARVLERSQCGARRYAALLLRTCEHEQAGRISSRLPVTAFVDAISHLERRVRRMTDRQPRLRSLPTAAAFVGLFLCAGMAMSVRVSRAGETLRVDPRMVPHVKMPGWSDPATADTNHGTVKAAPQVEGLSSLRNALPQLANNEHPAARTRPRVALPLIRREMSSVAVGERMATPAAYAPETLFVRSSNPIWPMKARIIFRDSGTAGRVVVTDRLGRTLPSADTLVVDGPVQLVLPEAPYHLSVESLTGDLSINTSTVLAPDGTSHWVNTILGRNLLAWRDASDTFTKLSAKGAAFVKSQRVP